MQYCDVRFVYRLYLIIHAFALQVYREHCRELNSEIGRALRA